MKKLRGSTVAKVTAITLLTVMAVCLAGCVAGGVFLYEFNAYSNGTVENVLDRMLDNKLRDAAAMVGSTLTTDPALDRRDAYDYYLNDDFRCQLTASDGRVIVDQLDGETAVRTAEYRLEYAAEYLRATEEEGTLYSVSVMARQADGNIVWGSTQVESVPLYINKPLEEYLGINAYPNWGEDAFYGPDGPEMPYYDTQYPDEASETDETEGTPQKTASPEKEIPAGYREPPQEDIVYTYTLTGCLVDPLTDWDYVAVNLFTMLSPFRYGLLVCALCALFICVMLFVFLMCAAGHRDGGEEVVPNFSDKIPSDLFAAAVGTGACVCVFFGVEIMIEVTGYRHFDPFFFTCGALLAVAGFILAVWLCMSFATRLKLGTVIKNSVCWKLLVLCWRVFTAVLRWLWRTLKRINRAIAALGRKIPLLSKTLTALAALLVLEFIIILSTEYDLGIEVFLWFMESAALSALVLYSALCLRRLQKGAREIARGNTAYTVDTRHMYLDFKTSAEDLNNIQAGINRAVNERMKSERFKTELITNVSHDIKTPLTSIINYVDLLGKEEPENEKMREYIDVLSRQSARLKKLIEDLIEASKASSGSLSVSLERCDLGVLVDQAAGEYAEKLAAAKLELVVKKPEEPAVVMADGRHTWRIFDNLMNNICKYAQPGTRVYIDLEHRGGRVYTVTFRNISRSQLNISGDELMERFVRGDSSRHTEGSGLGLSIARSLAQLQKGDLDLTVDGDLFKVVLSFSTAV